MKRRCYLLLPLLLGALLLPGGAAGEPAVRNQVLTLVPADGGSFDWFGSAVAVTADLFAIGSPGHGHGGAGLGAVYLYRKQAGGWTLLTELGAPPSAENEGFGGALALSGTTLAVGAAADDQAVTDGGAVYVFERHAGGSDAWGLVATLTASDAGASDRFGGAVDLVGSTLVVGAQQWDAPGTSNSGAAYVFERDLGGPGAWGEAARLVPSDPASYDMFGNAVATTGDVVVAGAPQDDDAGFSSGSAYVFERDAGGPGAWGPVAKLTASDAESDDRLGAAVAARGTTIVAGAYFEDEAAAEAGAAYVFQPGASGWEEQVKLLAPDGEANDRFGWAVAVDGEAVVVTAPEHAVFGLGTQGGTANWLDAGSAYVFTPDAEAPGGWSESMRLVRAPLAQGDQVGISAAAGDGLVLLGAASAVDFPAVDPGGAHLFERLDAAPVPSLTGPGRAVLALALVAVAASRRLGRSTPATAPRASG